MNADTCGRCSRPVFPFASDAMRASGQICTCIARVWPSHAPVAQNTATEPYAPKTAHRAKYRNEKTTVDGIVFDSKKEATRYLELRLMEKAGEIEGLQTQVPYHLIVNGFKICTYIADFAYFKIDEVVEDVKSEMTRKLPVYRMKKKLMKACLGIDITEV